MGDRDAGDFVSFMREQAGDSLRLVGLYNHETFNIQYVRPDLDRKFTEQDLREMATELRKESIERYHEEQAFTLGSLDATVRLFENAVIIHYPRGQISGTIVSLEREAGMQLSQFIEECRRQLYR